MAGMLEEVRRLLGEQLLAVLCTAQPNGQPYASLVAIAASENLTQVAFATLRATRKFANLSTEPRVALLLDDRANQPSDLLDAATVTLLGRACDTEGDERARWTAVLLARHHTLAELLASPDCAVVAIQIDRLLLVTRFQQVTELVVRSGEFEPMSAGAR